jgi:uncharacterized protein YpmB
MLCGIFYFFKGDRKMQKKKKSLIALAVLVVVVIALAVVYFATREEPVDGSKEITVEMIYDDVDRSVTITTDEEYLRGAMEQENLIAGNDSDYGLYVTEVDGRVADESIQEWWCITQDGDMTSTGVDEVVIADGDHFEFTLTTGW